MKSECGGDVHLSVAVVHSVESPDQRNLVRQAMPDIHPQIKREDDGRQADEFGELEPIKNAPVFSSTNMRRPDVTIALKSARKTLCTIKKIKFRAPFRNRCFRSRNRGQVDSMA